MASIPDIGADSGINLESPTALSWEQIYAQDPVGDTALHRILTLSKEAKDENWRQAFLQMLRAAPTPDLLEITNDWGQVSLARKSFRLDGRIRGSSSGRESSRRQNECPVWLQRRQGTPMMSACRFCRGQTVLVRRNCGRFLKCVSALHTSGPSPLIHEPLRSVTGKAR